MLYGLSRKHYTDLSDYWLLYHAPNKLDKEFHKVQCLEPYVIYKYETTLLKSLDDIGYIFNKTLMILCNVSPDSPTNPKQLVRFQANLGDIKTWTTLKSHKKEVAIFLF